MAFGGFPDGGGVVTAVNLFTDCLYASVSFLFCLIIVNLHLPLCCACFSLPSLYTVTAGRG